MNLKVFNLENIDIKFINVLILWTINVKKKFENHKIFDAEISLTPKFVNRHVRIRWPLKCCMI